MRCVTRSHSNEKRASVLTALTGDIEMAVARRRDTRGDAFTMTIGGVPYGKRNHAGHQLLQLLNREIAALASSGHPRIEARLGHLGGFDVTAATSRVLGTTQVALALDGVPESEIRLTATDLAETDPAGLVIRLENRLTGLESLKTRTAAEIDRLRTEAARAREDIEKPFPQSGQLAAARDRVRRIEEQLKEAATAQQRDGHQVPAETVVRDLSNPVGVQDSQGKYMPVSGAGDAEASGMAIAINGLSWKEPATSPPIPDGAQEPAETAGHPQPKAVTITQRGFPEHNPLAVPAEASTVVVSRPAASRGRSARPTR